MGDEAPVAELLAMHRIRKAWAGRTVLDDIELILDRGTMTSISGTNGIGKTTLLRIAVGLIMPDEGIIDLDCLHPRRDRAEFQRRIGFLTAGDRGLYARLTVGQHLKLWGRLSLLSTSKIRSAVNRTIQNMGLEELADRRVDRLSMGQRQRLRIAMIFMHEPEVVLLDEPLNSLDEEGADLLGRNLSALIERGGAGLWCSPGNDSPPVAFDQRLRLEEGKLHRVEST